MMPLVGVTGSSQGLLGTYIPRMGVQRDAVMQDKGRKIMRLGRENQLQQPHVLIKFPQVQE